MDDEQIKALFERKRELESKFEDYFLLEAKLDKLAYEESLLELRNFVEGLIMEGWIDLKLPQKAIINQFNHPPGVRSADQV